MKKDLKSILLASGITLLSAGVATCSFCKIRHDHYNVCAVDNDGNRTKDIVCRYNSDKCKFRERKSNNFYENVFGGSFVITLLSAYMARQISKKR